MSSPPTRPPRSSPPGRDSVNSSVAPSSGAKEKVRADSSRNRATPLPMSLAIGSVAVGFFALSFTVGQGQSPMTLAWGLLGYLLAGFAPPLLLGWDSASQRRGMKNPNFSARRGYSTALRAIVLVGILAAIFHLITIADVLALRISEWLYLMGWMTP